MIRKVWLLMVAALVFFFTEKGSAKHIIGGDMSYTCISLDTSKKLVNFRVTMKIYRDCSNPEGAYFDSDAMVGIYEKLPDGSFRYVKRIINLSYKQPIKEIDPSGSNPCLIVPPGVCVEEGIYEFTTGNLPLLNHSYYFAYQRCCRNETISNILQPGDAGAAFTLEITAAAQRSCNNSPRFRNFPPVVICVNNPLQFDHSAIDADGDLVTYEFCAPLTAGGQDGTPFGKNTCVGVTPDPAFCPPPYAPVTFRAPLYSVNVPLSGNPLITINPATGLITGTPTIQGQFVLGVCIREYRNGELLTETRRDFQFNVTYCEPKVFAKLQADSSLSGKEFVINLCGRQSLDFQNLSTDENFISSYKWTFLINGSEVTNSNRNARFTFPGLGTYKGKMVLNESTSCSDSAFLTVNIFPGINAGYRFDYDTCVPGPIRFTDQSQSGSGNLTSWSWDFSGNGTSAIRNPVHQFLTPGNKQVRLTVRDINGCRADTLATIPYYPVPPLLIVDPDVVSGCTPVKVCFRNLSVPLDTSYDIRWDFGDGNTGLGLSPCHEYRNGGLYTVKLQVTSPIGCYTERTYPDWIDVRQSPEAQFDSDPEELSSLNPSALFTDQSIFANSREWTFNDRDKSIQTGVQYTFRDTGLQKVQLIAVSNNGCRDTLIRYVDVEPIVTFFMPNAFTPNGDSKNDEFLGAGFTNGMLDFEMSIWSRWGSRIFSTGDPLQGWNGRYENSGNPLPNGVYAFVVRYLTPRDKLVTIKGFVTLIR